MNRSVLAATPLLLALSGCLTGGNIKGDFQCQAPGGTCAPMSSIDASAVAAIGSFRTVSDPATAVPAIPRSLPGPVLADGTVPPRTADRVLRVVFPAHVDSDGIYREESAAHAVVENAAWAEALGAPARPARGVPALRPSGILPASAATTGSAVGTMPGSVLATMDEIIAARAAGATSPSSEMTSRAPSLPTPPPASVGVAPTAAAATVITGSRSPFPISLAEVAAGLSAPRMNALDPLAPATDYDTPDVSAVRASPQRRASLSASAAPVQAGQPVARPASGQATAAAPFGTRPVRWKGRTYQVPYKNPQMAAAPASGSASPPAVDHTAELNRSALARTASLPPVATAAAECAAAPTYGPTTDAREAQDRLKAMAAPIFGRAIEDGRAAARDAAPAGFVFPVPATGTPQ